MWLSDILIEKIHANDFKKISKFTSSLFHRMNSCDRFLMWELKVLLRDLWGERFFLVSNLHLKVAKKNIWKPRLIRFWVGYWGYWVSEDISLENFKLEWGGNIFLFSHKSVTIPFLCTCEVFLDTGLHISFSTLTPSIYGVQTKTVILFPWFSR